MQDREPLSTRKLGEKLGVRHRALLREHDDAIRAIGRENRKGALNVFGRAKLDSFSLETQLLRELDCARRLGRFADILWVINHRDAGGRRNQLTEYRKALRHELGG